MNIGEFIVHLGFSADTFKLKDFARSLGELPLDAAAAVAALAGVEYELTKIAQQAMNTAVGFEMFTNQTGLSWKELQRWQIVAEQAHVSAETVASGVAALQRQIAAIRLGQGNIAPFQMLGIGINQNAFQVLEQLRQRIQGLDRATATNLITQMGLSPEMMNVLSLTDKQFAHLSATVAGMTGDQEGSFLRAKQALVQFGLVAKYVGFDIVDHLVEGLTLLVRGFQNLHLYMPAVIVAAAALAVAFAPMTAGVIALVLALDDLAVYFQGGDSVTGLAIEGIKKLGAAIKDNIPSLATLGKVAALGGFIGNPLTAAYGAANAAVSKVIQQTNTINVHSTAPPDQVGQAVKKEIDRGVSQASLQLDNQGH